MEIYRLLYKRLLRGMRKLPPSHQKTFAPKMAYNYRELFQTIQSAPPSLKSELLERVELDVKFLVEDFFTLDAEQIVRLLPQFENMTQNNSNN